MEATTRRRSARNAAAAASPVETKRARKSREDDRSVRGAPDDENKLWPGVDLMREVAERTEGRCVVLVTTGSFNPIHHGHIAMMEAALSLA